MCGQGDFLWSPFLVGNLQKGSDNMANNERDVRGRFKVHEEMSPIQLQMIAELLENGGT